MDIRPDCRQEFQTMSLQIFLCHAKEDCARVKGIHTKLKKSGFRPWIDEVDLHGGQDWEAVIGDAVRASDVVVVCLSNRSLTKQGFVQKEIRVALDAANERPPGKTYLIPVRLEDCHLPRELRRWHAIDLFNQNGFSRLKKSLSQLLGNHAPLNQQSSQQPKTNSITAFLDQMDRLWTSFDRVADVIPRSHSAMAKYAYSLDAFFSGYWEVFNDLIRKKASQNKVREAEKRIYDKSQDLLEKLWITITNELLQTARSNLKAHQAGKDLLESIPREPSFDKRMRSYSEAAELLRGYD